MISADDSAELRGSAPGPLSLSWAGLSTTIYKSHIFRIGGGGGGGGTTAAMMGVSDEDIQRMGSWKSQAFQKISGFPC